jgi:hypothetical protein
MIQVEAILLDQCLSGIATEVLISFASYQNRSIYKMKGKLQGSNV